MLTEENGYWKIKENVRIISELKYQLIEFHRQAAAGQR